MSRWLLTALLTCLAGASLASNSATSSVGWEQRLGAQLPLDARLRDESGRAVRLGDYFGDTPVIVVFAYFSCPQLCPLVLSGVGEAVQAAGLDLGPDARVLVVSIDPNDTPAQAAQQRQQSALRSDRANAVAYLTSDARTTASLAASAGFHFEYDAEHAQFAHAAGILIADRRGKISRYFFGVRYPPEQLRAAVDRARGGRIGNLTDQILMLCHAFDPTTGRYSSLVMLGIRILAGACFIVALGFWYRQAHTRGSA